MDESRLHRGAIDIAGHVYGRLSVIRFVGYDKNRRVYLCKCQCGAEKAVSANCLRRGTTLSCGCLLREKRAQSGPSHTTHGEGGRKHQTAEYRAWRTMINRCTLPSVDSYADYGARGIKVCDEWRRSYERFLSDMGRKPTPQHSLDRIDNDKGYEPGNCRWATPKEQVLNRRIMQMITYDGETLCMADWSRRLGGGKHLVRTRIKNGWPPHEAVSTAPDRSQRRAMLAAMLAQEVKP